MFVSKSVYSEKALQMFCATGQMINLLYPVRLISDQMPRRVFLRFNYSHKAGDVEKKLIKNACR